MQGRPFLYVNIGNPATVAAELLEESYCRLVNTVDNNYYVSINLLMGVNTPNPVHPLSRHKGCKSRRGKPLDPCPGERKAPSTGRSARQYGYAPARCNKSCPELLPVTELRCRVRFGRFAQCRLASSQTIGPVPEQTKNRRQPDGLPPVMCTTG